MEPVNIKQSPAGKTAIEHILAWINHDWDTTRELLAPDVHVVVATANPLLGEYYGIDGYMDIKVKAAKLIEPGSLQVLSAVGDERNALVMVSFRIGTGPGGAMMTMAKSGL